MARASIRLRPLLALALTFACVDSETGPSAPPRFVVAPGDPVTLVAAGDIAGNGGNDEATARLIDAEPAATVLSLGDNVYGDPSLAQFNAYYQPTWGRHKARTYFTLGNHDYNAPGGPQGVFDYVNGVGVDSGRAGARGRGYYSFDLGSWHVVVLNSEVSTTSSSAQVAWLKADLAQHPSVCTLAAIHRPYFTSGAVHPPQTSLKPLVDALLAAGADVMLSGHNHQYERFAPQDANGNATPQGIVQIVAGTGGYGPAYDFGTPRPNSVVRGKDFGIVKLTLQDGGYSFQFKPIAGQTFTDQGSATCSGADEPPPPPLLVPTALGFTGQPSNAQTDAAITPPVTVEIRDQFGARLAGATNTVTLAIGLGDPVGALAGTASVAAVDGVATFSDLSINVPASGYTLAATSGSLTGATSTGFDITAPPPPPPSVPITLSVSGGILAGKTRNALIWVGARGAMVDVYREEGVAYPTANDGRYVNSLTYRGAVTYHYRVCETGTTVCSNTAAVGYQ